MSFAGDEILDSQNSVYKNDLSQTPSYLTQREKLQWLQKQHTTGLWVQCDDCDRWRYLPSVLDSHELPKKWFCSMHPDIFLNKCNIPQEPIYDTENMLYGEYSAGSIVLAKLGEWPWWPAMVDDSPDEEQYYWLDGLSHVPTHYHVVFYDATKVSRAWLTPLQLKPYSQNKDLVKSSAMNKKYKKRLEVAIRQADDAEELPLQPRLKKYSFITRYKGKIANPHKLSNKIHQTQKFREHKNIIFLGSKNKNQFFCIPHTAG